jgi:hypothetical protein
VFALAPQVRGRRPSDAHAEVHDHAAAAARPRDRNGRAHLPTGARPAGAELVITRAFGRNEDGSPSGEAPYSVPSDELVSIRLGVGPGLEELLLLEATEGS